ncbi:MAG: phosphocholine cytidylyltransferase family protein [Bacteroidetes bacterium]|nr:phosphocholine cytidylyltransferase family protein [Bacteroidota bacterium]
MKAIILAAGRSSRLYPITLEKPKCLLEVGGRRIIDRQIAAIREIGIKDILIVVGYKGDVIKDDLGNSVRYREYHDYNKTNNLHTLWSVKDELQSDFLCFFSDVLFDSELIKKAKDSIQDFCMIIDTSRVLEGTMRVTIKDGKLTAIGSQVSISNASGNFIGIAKFTKAGANKLVKQMEKMISGYHDDYYTMAIDILAKKGTEIGYVDVGNGNWIEVDTKEDFERANQLFSSNSKGKRVNK